MKCSRIDCGDGIIIRRVAILTAAMARISPSMTLWKRHQIRSVRMSTRPPDFLQIECCDATATDRLGAQIAKSVRDGSVIELNGQLGSGKTRLVRAICDALGIDTSHVNSPTFVLLQLYTDGRIPVAHFDTYRLGDVDEFIAIGAEEFTNSNDWLCLIEWGERVIECLPDDRLRINISATSADARNFDFTSTGPGSSALLQRIRETAEAVAGGIRPL